MRSLATPQRELRYGFRAGVVASGVAGVGQGKGSRYRSGGISCAIVIERHTYRFVVTGETDIASTELTDRKAGDVAFLAVEGVDRGALGRGWQDQKDSKKSETPRAIANP